MKKEYLSVLIALIIIGITYFIMINTANTKIEKAKKDFGLEWGRHVSSNNLSITHQKEAAKKDIYKYEFGSYGEAIYNAEVVFFKEGKFQTVKAGIPKQSWMKEYMGSSYDRFWKAYHFLTKKIPGKTFDEMIEMDGKLIDQLNVYLEMTN